ncbi:uncharacterized protein LOC144425060 [Styela clava]
MKEIIEIVSNIVFTVILIRLIGIGYESGLKGVIKVIATFILKLPGLPTVLHMFTKREIKGFIKQTFEEKSDKNADRQLIPIPEKGIDTDELKKELIELKGGHGDLSEEGRLFAYVYTAHGKNFELQKEAFSLFNETPNEGVDSLKQQMESVKMYFEAFMHDNALNPTVFPALRKFENEVVAMTAHMLHGDGDTVGSVTSGGTESILMAMKTYRDRARALTPHIKRPNIVAPSSIHPAFEKAAHYFDIDVKHVVVGKETLQSNLRQYEQTIDDNTILLAASAPSYPQAIMDQIEDISEIARKRGLPMHVDACYGGFMLPWIEKLGHPIPKWDYRLPGVTSISADLHKYGFSTKGSSVITYRHESIRKYQFFAYSQWSGGLFASPTMAGTRPGGHLAASWVALRGMGQDGYIKMAEQIYDTAKKMQKGVNNIEGLKVLGNPLITGFAFGSVDKRYTVFQIADAMEKKGWKTEVQTNPDSIHCTVLPSHIKSYDQWLVDLAEVVKDLKSHPADNKEGVAAMYGMLSVVPDNAIIDEFLVDLFSDIYKS